MFDYQVVRVVKEVTASFGRWVVKVKCLDYQLIHLTSTRNGNDFNYYNYI